ncbi:hypothetical protein [Vampirovibrio chlorellavorus]|uniref:hypothetical protein n=1 Tax=Vampirovibrio chlorellavorus TaxID=758823 RepID=UPI003FCE5972
MQPPQTVPSPALPVKAESTERSTPPDAFTQAASATVLPVPPSSTMPVEVTQLAAQYLTALQQWQQSKQKESLEPVLNKGQEAARAILQRAETLTDEDFEALKKSMPGYLILHRDILVAGPDPAFFLTLATQKGKPADQAFFKLMNQTLNGYWPSTMEQLDDLSGCTRFGSGELVRLYGEWTAFKRQYPNAFAKALQDPNLLLLNDLEDQLVNSNAACEGPDSVQQELQRFVENFPKSPLTPKIRQRLLDLQQKKLDMSFNQGVRHRLKDDAGDDSDTGE